MIDYNRINQRGDVPRPLIYVAGPYTKGMQAHNVKIAIMYGEVIQDIGGIALVPHQNHIWDLIYPHDADFWLEQDLHLMKRCDALYRFNDAESPGADNEVVVCHRWKIPVFTDMDELAEWIGWFMAMKLEESCLT